MSIQDSLGDRMKGYEQAAGIQLMRRTPVIIRVDGRAFHTFTRRINEENDPSTRTHFSQKFHEVMVATTCHLVGNIQGARLAYTQSDEISILLRDWDTHETESWFDYNTMKVVSISAAMASVVFNYFWKLKFDDLNHPMHLAQFDARAFNLPLQDVDNYFIWRQKDAIRNSINFIGRKYFSQKQMQGKKTQEVKQMLIDQHFVDWSQYPAWEQRGACIVRSSYTEPHMPKTLYHDNIPVFSEQRSYITQHLEILP